MLCCSAAPAVAAAAAVAVAVAGRMGRIRPKLAVTKKQRGVLHGCQGCAHEMRS